MLKMKEIIWVIGVSAVGKETFCEYILKNPKPELLDAINILGKAIAVSEISKRATGKFTGDPIVNERQKIPKEVEQLLQEHDVVFVKWQFVDMTKGVFEEIERTIPDVEIKIVLLRADDETIAERLQKKEWWQKGHMNENPMQNVLDEERIVKEQLGILKKKYQVVVVHSDPNFNFV